MNSKLKFSIANIVVPEVLATNVFKSSIVPDVDVSQYMSSLDSTGSVSNTAKFSKTSYTALLAYSSFFSPNCSDGVTDVINSAIKGFDSDLKNA